MSLHTVNLNLPIFSPTLVNHEAPQIAEEKPNTSFIPCPPPFPVPIWVPPYGDFKADKSTQHVPNPSSHLSLASMEEVPEWIRKPIAKTYSSIPQEDINIHNLSLEHDLPLCHPPSDSQAMTPCTMTHLINLFHQPTIHIISILELVAQIMIRHMTITLHR